MASRNYILAHDLGTTGNKANLFDADGKLVATSFAEYATDYPQPNWVEQNPHDWWQAVCDTSKRLISEAGISASEIAAVSFSGHMMGMTPVDKAGNPLRSCIIWADQRAQPQAEAIIELLGADEVYRKTGHRASAAYSMAKLMWMRDHQPELYAQTDCVFIPKDYCVFKLTGSRVTDYSDASGTNMFDLVSRSWMTEQIEKVGLDPAKLPALKPSNAVVGEITASAARETGLAQGTPVVIGGGDGACAGIGAGVIAPGEAFCYIGSSAWISVCSRQPLLDPAKKTTTFHYLHPEYYMPTGSIQAAGGARDWTWELLEGVRGSRGASQLDELAAGVPAGSKGVLCLPYLLGERSPWWNPLARAAWVGMAMSHGRAEMARAALEGVAMTLRMILDVMRAQVPEIQSIRLIGGGSKSPLWRQIFADCWKLPVHELELKGEATSWGAAVAGGVAVGLYDWEIAARRTPVINTVEPIAVNSAVYDELLAITIDTYQALQPIYGRLAKLG